MVTGMVTFELENQSADELEQVELFDRLRSTSASRLDARLSRARLNNQDQAHSSNRTRPWSLLDTTTLSYWRLAKSQSSSHKATSVHETCILATPSQAKPPSMN